MLEKKSISRKTFAILMESPTFVILTVLSIYPFVYTLYYSLTNFYYISKDGLDFVGLKIMQTWSEIHILSGQSLIP